MIRKSGSRNLASANPQHYHSRQGYSGTAPAKYNEMSLPGFCRLWADMRTSEACCRSNKSQPRSDLFFPKARQSTTYFLFCKPNVDNTAGYYSGFGLSSEATITIKFSFRHREACKTTSGVVRVRNANLALCNARFTSLTDFPSSVVTLQHSKADEFTQPSEAREGFQCCFGTLNHYQSVSRTDGDADMAKQQASQNR